MMWTTLHFTDLHVGDEVRFWILNPAAALAHPRGHAHARIEMTGRIVGRHPSGLLDALSGSKRYRGYDSDFELRDPRSLLITSRSFENIAP